MLPLKNRNNAEMESARKGNGSKVDLTPFPGVPSPANSWWFNVIN
jgi:hypothetical protein